DLSYAVEGYAGHFASLLPETGGSITLARAPSRQHPSHVSHSHDHALDARLGRDRRRLVAALVLVAGLMALEIAGGVVAHSLALLADAGHMLGDAVSLALALVAAWLAAKPAGGRWTFGLGRTEVLAAQVNGIA